MCNLLIVNWYPYWLLQPNQSSKIKRRFKCIKGYIFVMVLSFRIGICLRCFKNSFIEVFVKNIYYDVECLNINEFPDFKICQIYRHYLIYLSSLNCGKWKFFIDYVWRCGQSKNEKYFFILVCMIVHICFHSLYGISP